MGLKCLYGLNASNSRFFDVSMKFNYKFGGKSRQITVHLYKHLNVYKTRHASGQ